MGMGTGDGGEGCEEKSVGEGGVGSEKAGRREDGTGKEKGVYTSGRQKKECNPEENENGEEEGLGDISIQSRN